MLKHVYSILHWQLPLYLSKLALETLLDKRKGCCEASLFPGGSPIGTEKEGCAEDSTICEMSPGKESVRQSTTQYFDKQRVCHCLTEYVINNTFMMRNPIRCSY